VKDSALSTSGFLTTAGSPAQQQILVKTRARFAEQNSLRPEGIDSGERTVEIDSGLIEGHLGKALGAITARAVVLLR
jgi:hypothetical protein